MKILVGTEPTRLPFTANATPMIQNMGPGAVYFDSDPDVSPDTGIKMPEGAVYEFPSDLGAGGGSVYFIAEDGEVDLRVMRIG